MNILYSFLAWCKKCVTYKFSEGIFSVSHGLMQTLNNVAWKCPLATVNISNSSAIFFYPFLLLLSSLFPHHFLLPGPNLTIMFVICQKSGSHPKLLTDCLKRGSSSPVAHTGSKFSVLRSSGTRPVRFHPRSNLACKPLAHNSTANLIFIARRSQS